MDKKEYDNTYRKAEAMYHANKTTEEIARAIHLPRWEVLYIIQDIFGKEMMRKEH